MMNCVERLKEYGIPYSTILMMTAFMSLETIENYIQACEKEKEKS